VILFLAIGAFLVGAVAVQAASGGNATVAASPREVSAAVRSVQPAVSGLFQVHAPRVWSDALDEFGNPGANGVPDVLEAWEAFRAREDSAILKNGYAFRTIEGGDEILYAGVLRKSAGGPSKVVFEFNQKPGERLLGDLLIGAEIDASGNLGTVRFESYGEGKAGLNLRAMLSGEGCNDSGTACIVANGAFLEAGVNLTRFLVGATEPYKSIQISTPEDSVVGLFSLTGVAGGCVSEVSGFKAGCTANDIQLTAIVPGSLSIPSGGNNCVVDPTTGALSGTVTFSATGRFVLTTQTRYDVGLFIDTNGDPEPTAKLNGKDVPDAGRNGQCTRFAFTNTDGVNAETPADSCGDLTGAIASAPLGRAMPFGPVTIKCVDKDLDGRVDVYHCETWSQNEDEIDCTSSSSVKAGTSSKCNCGLLAGACIPTPSTDACKENVCTLRCSNDSTKSCTIGGTECTAPGFCQDTLITQNKADGSACGDQTSGDCKAPDTCQAGVCTTGFQPSTTICRASAGQCDVAESCTGSSTTCPANAFQPSTTTCVGTSNGGPCDATDSCSGTANTCVDGFKSSTTICRASAGQCDVAESCTGSSGACPADAFQPSTTACVGTSNGGPCDGTDSCNGTANTCVDGFKSSTTICRESAGCCDVPESCTGTSGACPANGFQPATTICRPSAGKCDAAESCTGSSADCPGDACSATPNPPDLTCSVTG
jgi:hypothetical protein